jgi:ABC-type Co2+ transport system permease subunit
MIVGPWYGVVAAFLFNILRALIGDGAFTNIGLNTCIIWLEIALGAALWSALRPLAQRRSPALAAGIATFTALLLATAVFVGVIALSTVDPVRVAETGVYDARAGGFKDSPLSGGIFGVHFLEGAGGTAEAGEAGDGAGAENTPVGLAAFAGVFFVLAAAGALIESVITGAVVSFIAKVRPHLLGLRPTPLRTTAVASPAVTPEPVT